MRTRLVLLAAASFAIAVTAAPALSNQFQEGTITIPPVTESLPCPGSLPLTLGGTLAYRSHTVQMKGGNFMVQIQTRLDGMTATDSAGNSYTFDGIGNAHVVVHADSTASGVGVGNVRVEGSGPDAGIQGHVNVDITVNNLGVISLAFDNMHVVCH